MCSTRAGTNCSHADGGGTWWPIPSTTMSRAPGMAAARASPCGRGNNGSAVPTTSVGAVICRASSSSSSSPPRTSQWLPSRPHRCCGRRPTSAVARARVLVVREGARRQSASPVEASSRSTAARSDQSGCGRRDSRSAGGERGLRAGGQGVVDTAHGGGGDQGQRCERVRADARATLCAMPPPIDSPTTWAWPPARASIRPTASSTRSGPA